MKRLVLAFLLLAAPAFAQGNLLADVAAARTHYGTPMSPADQAALLNEVAWAHQAEGWGLLAKPSGNNCPSPAGVRVSCDYLLFAPTGQGFDVLSDAEGAGIPTWNRGDSFDQGRFVPPVPPAGATPTPAPPPPPPAQNTVLERVTALQARIEDVLQRLEAQSLQLSAISHQLEIAQVALERAGKDVRFPVYTTTLFGQKMTLTPKQP